MFPSWFGYFRLSLATILTIIFLKYSIYDNFKKLQKEATLGMNGLPDGSKLTMDIFMCANGVMGVDVRQFSSNGLNGQYLSQNTSQRCIPLRYETSKVLGIWIDASIPFNSVDNSTINNNQSDDIINSYHNDKINLKWGDSSILPNNILKLTIHTTLFMPGINNCPDSNRKAFHFYPRQAFFIYVSPKAVLYELDCQIELDLQSEQLPLNLDANKVGLGVYLKMPLTYETVKAYGTTDYLSDIGGFYGTIAGIFAVIFGAGKLEPWGLAHKYLLVSVPGIRNSTKKFENKYGTTGGIPLVEKVKERPKNPKPLESLEDRIQILESLLKDHYLDVYYLEKVEYIKGRKEKMNELLDEV